MRYKRWARMSVLNFLLYYLQIFHLFSTCIKGGGRSFPVKAQLAHSAHGPLPTPLLHSLTSSDRSSFFCLQPCVSFLDNSFLCISSFYSHRFVCLLSVPCARSHTVHPSDFYVPQDLVLSSLLPMCSFFLNKPPILNATYMPLTAKSVSPGSSASPRSCGDLNQNASLTPLLFTVHIP